mgnify:FL=1
MESEPDVGSCFAFTLPLADLAVTVQQTVKMDSLLRQIKGVRWLPSAGRKTILVVDDEEPIRQVLKQSLEAAGHQVLLAVDGLAGLTEVRKERPDLIVLDVMMPKLNGFDVAASLKNDPEYLGIPILMLTVVDDAQRAYAMGVERYINKPFEPSRVVSEVEDLLRERQELGHAIVLGDAGDDAEELEQALVKGRHNVEFTPTIESFQDALTTSKPSLVIVFGEENLTPIGRIRVKNAMGSTSALIRYVSGEE